MRLHCVFRWQFMYIYFLILQLQHFLLESFKHGGFVVIMFSFAGFLFDLNINKTGEFFFTELDKVIIHFQFTFKNCSIFIFEQYRGWVVDL